MSSKAVTSRYVSDAIAKAERLGSVRLSEFLRGVRPEVERLLMERKVPLPEAEEVLRDVLQNLVWRWEGIRSRDAWLLTILDKRLTALLEEPAVDNEDQGV